MWFTPLDNGFESQRNFAHPAPNEPIDLII